MISVTPSPSDAAIRTPSEAASAQAPVALRKEVRDPGSKTPNSIDELRRRAAAGFTLIEMMVVVVVLTIVGTIAFASIRGDQFDSHYRRYTEDLMSQLIKARNLAIDNQSPARVTVFANSVVVQYQDPEDLQWRPWKTVTQNAYGSGILATEGVCITDLHEGVTPPGMTATDLPTACLATTRNIEFGPDGMFEIDATGLGGERGRGTGTTLVIADNRTPTDPTYTLIEMFPGGLVRKHDKVKNQ